MKYLLFHSYGRGAVLELTAHDLSTHDHQCADFQFPLDLIISVMWYAMSIFFSF